jgi:hypothetical protein
MPTRNVNLMDELDRLWREKLRLGDMRMPVR